MQQDQKESGSFMSGFGIGLLTGAAAYFLFGTEQGKELRKKALSEWDSMQGSMSKESGIEMPKQLRQVMREVVGYFAESIKQIQDIQESANKPKTVPTKTKKPETKAKSSSRFKGL